jgi:hypothetical protein
LRADLNADRGDGQPKLTILPFLIRALVAALPAFPQINAHLLVLRPSDRRRVRSRAFRTAGEAAAGEARPDLLS